MQTATEIRVGICGCMGLYHGQLQGRGMIIEGERYVLKEVRLPNNKNHTADLKAGRCHFFIDDGKPQSEEEIYIFVAVVDLVRSPSGRSERLVDILFNGMARDKHVVRDRQWLLVGTPRTSSGMIRYLRCLLASMKPRARTEWLERMAFAPRLHDLSA